VLGGPGMLESSAAQFFLALFQLTLRLSVRMKFPCCTLNPR
jgi:hypothetical protein